jgi:DNA/RNA endonuclease G (NUC1)
VAPGAGSVVAPVEGVAPVSEDDSTPPVEPIPDSSGGAGGGAPGVSVEYGMVEIEPEPSGGRAPGVPVEYGVVDIEPEPSGASLGEDRGPHPERAGTEADYRTVELDESGPDLDTVTSDERDKMAARFEKRLEAREKAAEAERLTPAAPKTPEELAAERQAAYKEATKRLQIPGVKKQAATRGAPSDELTGTGMRSGQFYGELNAAEIERGMKLEYDEIAGRPVRVEYRIDADIAGTPGAEQERGFSADLSTQGAQSKESAYTNSGYDRGHLAQREAFKGGTAEALKAADYLTNVVPMRPELNRAIEGPDGKFVPSDWRLLEIQAVKDLAPEHGYVMVEVVPIYPEEPERLSDGTPIPSHVTKIIRAPDGTVLVARTFEN